MLDHFLCYKVRRARGEAKFKEEEVSLSDQFDEFREQENTVDLSGTEQFCDAVQVKQVIGNKIVTFPIIDPTAHQTCYKVSRPTSKIDPEVIVTNQMGAQELSVKRGRTRLCVPSEAVAVVDPTPTPTAQPTPTATPTAPPPPPPLEHFELYKAKRTPGSKKFERREVDVVDPFLGLKETVKLTRPVRLGVPTDKNEEGIINETTHLTCYKVQAPRFVRRDVIVVNQFNEWSRLTVKRPYMLCVPSLKLVVSED